MHRIERAHKGKIKQYTPAKMSRLFRHYAKREKDIRVEGGFHYLTIKTATGKLEFRFR